MNKLISIETIAQLTSILGRFSTKLGIAPVTRESRRQLTVRIKMSPTEIRSAAAAAKAHPDLFGDNVDPKGLLADVAFVEATEAAVASIETLLRGIGDEVLARKARSSQGALAIKRILEAGTHTQPGADLVSTLGALGKRGKRGRKAALPASTAAPPQVAKPVDSAMVPTAGPRLVVASS